MTDSIQDRKTMLAALPAPWPEDLMPAVAGQARNRKLVVLDDDPTGTQTVHGIPVLTEWSVDTLAAELGGPETAFFILTNSRSLEREAACELGREIGRNLEVAARKSGIRPVLVSRSDSTLRGHFPHEVDAMAETFGDADLPYLIFPFFPEGGRYTIGDIHYVAEGDDLVPAARTPYAGDAAFGFTTSDLKRWVAEKTNGRIPADRVTSVSLDDIRNHGPERVSEILARVPDRSACTVNAVDYRDVEVVVTGLNLAMEQGRRFLFRTAAAFVRVMAGITPRPALLTRAELASDTGCGGLFIVGSYVPKTTAQIRCLVDRTGVFPVEMDVARLLDPDSRAGEISRVADLVNTQLARGTDVAVFTSRTLITGDDAGESLDIGRTVSDSLIRIVRRLARQPRYLVAKGGITSSDVATKGLAVRRAMVSGQILPGVPVWKLGPESRYPGMSYVVFPGNVGDDTALTRIQSDLGGRADLGRAPC